MEPQPSDSSSSDYFRSYRLLFEFKAVVANPQPGIILAPSNEDNILSEILGTIFVDQGPWTGGVFQFSIHLPQLMSPETIAKGIKVRFLQPMWHPFVDIVDGTAALGTAMSSTAEDKPGSILLPVLNAIRKLFTDTFDDLQRGQFRVVNRDALRLYAPPIRQSCFSDID
eukprot:TRINITY_DN3752_c0_g1_i1.p1 TRINITY_DN3752_c0_g1~~TRINITY_DN3752_c0_g1_i1.p1  ORF type:complete len:169 (-),score=26.49 TRINITY_DN3752_c0_g1_i1:676-1182(-)